MKLGKSKKNTPGCLTNKAMEYIKSKPAMYGKPKAYGKPAPECEGLKGEAFRDCQIKVYNKKFGEGAYQKYVANKNTKN